MPKGSDSFWHYIRRWLDSEQTNAPLLISGPTDAAWENFTHTISKFAVCTDTKNRPCGSCRQCVQVAHNANPDIVIVTGDEKVIRISHIRELREALLRTPFGRIRLVIIPHAERLRREAANMLLKELEESSLTNRFVLTTAYRSRILPTIRSRCEHLSLSPEFTTTEQTTMNVDEAHALLIAFASAKKREALDEGELINVGRALTALARQGKDSPLVYRSLLRLKDYYKIRALRGNEKLAADVLLASISQLRNTNH